MSKTFIFFRTNSENLNSNFGWNNIWFEFIYLTIEFHIIRSHFYENHIFTWFRPKKIFSNKFFNIFTFFI